MNKSSDVIYGPYLPLTSIPTLGHVSKELLEAKVSGNIQKLFQTLNIVIK